MIILLSLYIKIIALNKVLFDIVFIKIAYLKKIKCIFINKYVYIMDVTY